MRYLLFTAMLAACALVGCMPPASETTTGCRAGDDVSLAVDPPAPPEAIPPVVHLRLRSCAGAIDPERVALFEGELGNGHLTQIARGEPSLTLLERQVPGVAWALGDEVVVAPHVTLTAGERYTLASGDPPASVTVEVAAATLPVLRHVWPPDGVSAGALHAVWCGDAPLEVPDASVALLPSAEATVSVGAAGAGLGRHCVRLDVVGPGPASPPPALHDASGLPVALLEPVVLSGGASPESIVPLACTAPDVSLGPGCATVADDRLWVARPDTALLWVLSDGADLDHVSAGAGDVLLAAPLPPSSSVWLQLVTIDRSGASFASATTITTHDPMAHVVINEVLANPVGVEPGQEWVELYNDGLAAAQLADWQLEDIGGETLLPSAWLAPGMYALIVNEGYDADSEHDPQPAPGTPLIRVPKLGKNGLNNQGEPLTLRRPDGVVVSRAPATPKPKAGQSVARIHPKAPDDGAASFVRSEENASTPGAVNVVE